MGCNETHESYDIVHRLDYSTLNGVTNLNVDYFPNGNIAAKNTYGPSGVLLEGLAYTYGTSRPHAVSQVAVTGNSSGTWSFAYNANGSLGSRAGSTVTWHASGLPRAISGAGGVTSTFENGPEGQYWRQSAVYGTGPETTTYVGGLFERVVGGTVTAYRNYLKAGDRTIGIWTYRTNGNHVGYHPLRDHLGSTDAITDHTGQLIVRESYEAYGKRRDPLDWDGPPSSGPGSDLEKIANTGRRGFTQHTMLDNLSLIHMNGRVFDPVIGRFVSADPFIDVEVDAQGWNRYSYVKNNPLTATDPTGHVANLLTGGVGFVVGAVSGVAVEFVADGFGTGDSTAADYFGAFAGGAVAGGLVGLNFNPVAAGAVGGAVSSIVTQAGKNLEGKQRGIRRADIAVAAAAGALTANLVKGVSSTRVRGITAGRGSMEAVIKAMATKLDRGKIESVRPLTFAKGALAGVVSDTRKTAVEAATTAAASASGQKVEGAVKGLVEKPVINTKPVVAPCLRGIPCAD